MSNAVYHCYLDTPGAQTKELARALALWPKASTIPSPNTASRAKSQRAIVLWEAKADGITLALKLPLVAIMRQEDGHWFVDCDDLGIFVTASDEDACNRAFASQFIATRDGLKGEPDDALTPDAIELRELFRQYAP